MNITNKNINNIFFIFVLSHLIIWTLTPSLTNKNLPLDTIEHLAWGSNLDWGFNKHPPMVAFVLEFFYQIFGSQDWAYYLLSQIFLVIAFYYVFKLACEILENLKLALIAVLLLVSIYFYNFTTPEFNVNVCQLPFWSLVVYYSWKIYSSQEIKFLDCFLVGLFSAIGFLSKYLFLYLLVSIDLLFIYLIFFKKTKKFDFKYLITIEVFIVLLVPHLIWLFNNDFITITYGLNRTGLESSSILDHISNSVFFLSKQIGILIPFFFLIWLLAKRIKFKLNIKDKKLMFLLFINFMPIILMFLTSLITGSKIRTMWMTPFYLFFGVLFLYLLKSQINLKKINSFLYGFLFLFFLSPVLYSYVSLSQTDKRTDYPGKEISIKIQYVWDQDFDKEIQFVTGDEWKAGNLSYHLKSRPKWEGLNNKEMLNNSSQFICVGDVCLGRY
ncbi:glycosyltransferase family 39 protein [Candidatus Pelagibacter sp.]|nr:glycosyltransferase family 39 protein [Candidatus Pelagibacter sp.]